MVPVAGGSLNPGSMYEATTVTVSITRPADTVYAYISDPSKLAEWSFFQSAVPTDDGWRMGTPAGEALLRLVDANDFGVADHTIQTSDGREVYIPMRVVPNGEGSEVIFTAFRAPGMSDEEYAADVSQVEADLGRLKELLEAATGPTRQPLRYT